MLLFSRVSKRSPILGYNHNIGHRGLVFHVQTEDSGVDNPHIFTHLFHGGVIIFTRKIDYDAAADESLVKSLMQAQHKAMLKELKRGMFDERVDSFLGDHPDLTPRKVRDTIPEGPADTGLLIEPTVSPADTLAESAPEAAAAADTDEDWISTPSEITSSEVSDVFRIIMQPSLDAHGPGQGDGGDVELFATPEIRIESLKPGAPSRRVQRDTVEIHSKPPSEELPEPEQEHHGSNTLRHRAVPPPPPQQRPVQRAAPASAHVGPRGSGNVLVSRPPIRVDSHTAPMRAKPQQASARTSRPMAPRTVREEPFDSLFDQQTISEKSLDEVILAYLSEDSGKDEP